MKVPDGCTGSGCAVVVGVGLSNENTVLSDTGDGISEPSG